MHTRQNEMHVGAVDARTRCQSLRVVLSVGVGNSTEHVSGA